jgi:hypothetical protein
LKLSVRFGRKDSLIAAAARALAAGDAYGALKRVALCDDQASAGHGGQPSSARSSSSKPPTGYAG